MTAYDHAAFENFQKNLSGENPFDNAVTACIGTDKEQIETFINESSIFDLQDHFRAAGQSCASLLDLSDDIVSLRMPKKKSGKNHPIHDMGVIKFAGGWLRVGRVIPGDAEPPPPPVEKDPAIMKFFNVLARLKAQDAKASMILVEGWIEKDLVGAQTTMERRNAIRSMLFRHQFDIP